MYLSTISIHLICEFYCTYYILKEYVYCTDNTVYTYILYIYYLILFKLSNFRPFQHKGVTKAVLCMYMILSKKKENAPLNYKRHLVYLAQQIRVI